MVDNFEQIKSLLSFNNENEFYFLQILQRKKDRNIEDKKALQLAGSNNNSRLIKAYYIYSVEQLEKNKVEIIELCKLFNARACISLNKRNSKDIALEMLADLAYNIKSNHVNFLQALYNTTCGKYHSDKDKTWIIDVDGHWDKHIVREKVEKELKNIEPLGDNKVITWIPTKNGLHIITKPFNSQKFREKFPELDIHKNNPTLIYCI